MRFWRLAPQMPHLPSRYSRKLTSGSNSTAARDALLVLQSLGTNGQKHLLSMMADEKNPYRYQALLVVDHDPDFFQPGSNADAFPVLEQCMQSKDKKVAFLAVELVGELGFTSDICFPVLVAALTNSDPQIRWSAAVGLDRYSERTNEVEPILRRVVLTDPDAGVRQGAVDALNWKRTNNLPFFTRRFSSPRP